MDKRRHVVRRQTIVDRCALGDSGIGGGLNSWPVGQRVAVGDANFKEIRPDRGQCGNDFECGGAIGIAHCVIGHKRRSSFLLGLGKDRANSV